MYLKVIIATPDTFAVWEVNQEITQKRLVRDSGGNQPISSGDWEDYKNPNWLGDVDILTTAEYLLEMI